MNYIVHTDGGSRGNPGQAAIGVVIYDDTKKIIQEFGKTIGETTNNVAEYTAVIEALAALKKITGESPHIDFYLDSTLVVNQLNGVFKIKDARLRALVTTVHIEEQEVGGVVTYTYVPREKNKRADLMVNQALDAGL
jgi:ribonuclease HI